MGWRLDIFHQISFALLNGSILDWKRKIDIMSTAYKFVVQAKCTDMGWVDTCCGADDKTEAFKIMELFVKNDSAWMPGERIARVWNKAVNLQAYPDEGK